MKAVAVRALSDQPPRSGEGRATSSASAVKHLTPCFHGHVLGAGDGWGLGWGAGGRWVDFDILALAYIV